MKILIKYKLWSLEEHIITAVTYAFCNNIGLKVVHDTHDFDIELSNIGNIQSLLLFILKYKNITQTISNEHIIEFLNSKDNEIFLLGYHILRHHKNLDDIKDILQYFNPNSNMMWPIYALRKLKEII